jgi:hypothetical protein
MIDLYLGGAQCCHSTYIECLGQNFIHKHPAYTGVEPKCSTSLKEITVNITTTVRTSNPANCNHNDKKAKQLYFPTSYAPPLSFFGSRNATHFL